MAVRILHCGNSIENYLICAESKIVGFSKRLGNIGDVIYLVVKINGKSICGVRGVLSDHTDLKPWKDSDLYVQRFDYDNLEYCEPFDISILEHEGGKYWALKYVQASKEIKVEEALRLLNDRFDANKTNILNKLEDYIFSNESTGGNTEVFDEEIDSDEVVAALVEVPDSRINIMGTFLTVKFFNETDQIRGIEKLVSDNFYNLFKDFPKEETILISENRMFVSTKAKNSNKELVSGTSGIPDGVLIRFNKKDKSPIQINLIEYECYGETKIKTLDKFEYLNGHIIPQLMRFASTFSIITDSKIREETIEKWVSKIMKYIEDDVEINNKCSEWIRKLDENVVERGINREIERLLKSAFRSNLRIVLIIDELTIEQKETIRNIINSFKLDNGKGIEFLGFVVRLEQKINLINTDFEYALAIQI